MPIMQYQQEEINNIYPPLDLKPSLRTVISDIATLENMAIKFAVLLNTDDLSGVKLAKNRYRPINIKMATNNVVRNITPDVLTPVVETLLTLNNMSYTLVAYLYIQIPKSSLMGLFRVE